MPRALGGDLGVDVLVVGAGLQACYLADALHPRFSVCVLDDPAIPIEVLDGDGVMAAGYDGDDVARIQPARRAASFWRLWAIDHGLDPDAVPVLRTMAPGEEANRTARWRDAALPFAPLDELPEALRGGSAEGEVAFGTPNDVVLDPATVLAGLRSRIADRIVRGSVASFASYTDQVVDLVELDVDGELVPVVARFVVLAADAANAGLAHQLASRLGDPDRRRAAKAAIATGQANVRQQVVAVRGELPLLAGRFDGLTVTAHPAPDGDPAGVVWLVSPDPDVAGATAGPEDVRFAVPVDRAAVADVVGRLRRLSPWLDGRAADLEWATWGRRLTQHPSLAGPDRRTVLQPVPARLEALGLEGFLALWPSHPAYAMVLGDVAAERIADHLGTSAAFSEGLEPADLREGPLPDPVARWRDPRTTWQPGDRFLADLDQA